MKAMILAAGRGERMRPLTDTCPKPLLDVAGTPLIGWHLQRLGAAGIREIVINHAWLGAQIERVLGQGEQYGVQIAYSAEGTALETAGGIAKALPLLGDAPFLVVNGDVFTDIDFTQAGLCQLQPGMLAHLILVPNPPQHPAGDFAIDNGLLRNEGEVKYTFSGIGLYSPSLFASVDIHRPSKLAPLLRAALEQNRVTAEVHQGLWLDVGTIERLAAARVLAASC